MGRCRRVPVVIAHLPAILLIAQRVGDQIASNPRVDAHCLEVCPTK